MARTAPSCGSMTTAAPELAGSPLDIGPSDFGIRAEFLSFDEGDFAMAELRQMLECDFGGPHVVQHNVGHALHMVVSRDCDHRDRERKSPGSIDRDQAVD